MNRCEFYIDVEDSSGAKLGSGPITSALYWRQEFAMDQAGAFETVIPLADRQATNIASERVLRCFAIIPGAGPTEIGSGVIDNIAYEPSPQGMMVRVKGLDEMRYLLDRSVLFLALGGSGSPPTVSHATAINSIETYAPSGWNFIPDGSVPFNEIIYRYRGESVLQALVQMAAFSKTHFYLSGPKEITFKSVFTDSGVVCINEPPIGHAQAGNVAFVSKYSYIKETKDIMTRAYAYGGWYNGVFSDYFIPIGEVNYGLSSGDPDYWPSPKYAGYTDNRSDNWIERDASVSAWGRRERQIQFPQVKVTFFTGGYSNEIWRDLCRLVYNRAVADLDWFGVEAEFYQLQLQNCNIILKPLEYARVILNVVEDGRAVFQVDDNLLILSSQIEVSERGVRTTNVELSNAERYRLRDPYATIGFANWQFNDQYT